MIALCVSLPPKTFGTIAALSRLEGSRVEAARALPGCVPGRGATEVRYLIGGAGMSGLLGLLVNVTRASETPAATLDVQPFWESVHERRYHSSRQLGRNGLAVIGASMGIGIAYPLAAIAICPKPPEDAYLSCEFLATLAGIYVEFGVAIAALTGEGLMFAGGIQAATAARRMGRGRGWPVLGWAGLGLVTAGTATIVAVSPTPEPYDLQLGIAGVAAVVTGTALGVVQLAQIGAFDRTPLALVPTPHGVALAGQF